MKLLKSFSVYHSLPSIHNKTAAQRETKYIQAFVQQSPFGNGIRVTVMYAAVDRYIQINNGLCRIWGANRVYYGEFENREW